MRRFEIIARDSKPTADAFTSHPVKSTTQCSIRCRQNKACYSWAIEPNVEMEFSCFLYSEEETHTDLVSCTGCVYAMSMMYIEEEYSYYIEP